MAKFERSYGIIPMRRSSGFWELLLICQRSGGHWGFPKGHAEENESPQQTAQRELFEETGLNITQWLEHPPLSETYSFLWSGERIQKEVVYYPALVEGTLKPQQEEVIFAEWVPLEKAASRVTFPQIERILVQLTNYLIHA